jgi:putative ABC transport system permease protein
MYGAVAVRTSLPPEAVIPEIRSRLARLDASVPLVDFRTVEARVHDSLDEPRFYSWLAAACAGMAVLFVAFGLYGLVSFSVSRRTAEFGIRMAVGATGGSIQQLVMRQGARMAVAGALIGVGLSVAPSRVLRALPFPVRPVDAGLIGASVALVMLVTLVASWVPAWRASRVSPLSALRAE